MVEHGSYKKEEYCKQETWTNFLNIKDQWVPSAVKNDTSFNSQNQKAKRKFQSWVRGCIDGSWGEAAGWGLLIDIYIYIWMIKKRMFSKNLDFIK